MGVAGSVFSVDIELNQSVEDLKEAIKDKSDEAVTGPLPKLQLFLAKKDNMWLKDDDTLDAVLQSGDVTSYEKMRVSWELNKSELFGSGISLGENVIHVLVLMPESQTITPSVGDRKRSASSGIAEENLLLVVQCGLELSDADLAVGRLLELPKNFMGIDIHEGLVLVLGSPGIGKSVFGVFLFLKCMTEKENIAYHPVGDSQIYYFTWTMENGYETSLAPHTGISYVGLFDGNDAIGGYAYSQFRHSYLFASPHTSNYNHFSKQHCLKVYMNPWTKTECAEFADAIHLESNEWLPRFNLVGGKPRLVFAALESLHRLLVRVEGYIFLFSAADMEKQVKLFQAGTFDDRISHTLFTIFRNERVPSAFYLNYSSMVVEAIVDRRFSFTEAAEINSLLSPSKSNLESWRRNEIETWLLRDLACNRVRAKPLEGGDSKEWESYQYLVTRIAEIEDASEIKVRERMLHVPLSKTFPTIDAVAVKPQDGIIFYVQVTVSKVHPIQYQRLKDVYLALTGRSEFKGYKHILLFMVSSDMYDEFTLQPYQNEDRTIRTEKLDIEVLQYVGKSTNQ